MHKATILLFLPWAMVAETHTVAPEKYYRTFSHQHPVLKRILAGDTVITKTVDSGGKDEKGVERSGGRDRGAVPQGQAESQLGNFLQPPGIVFADSRVGGKDLCWQAGDLGD